MEQPSARPPLTRYTHVIYDGRLSVSPDPGGAFVLASVAESREAERHAQLAKWLEDRAFYEVMQAYRHAPMTDLEGTVAAFEAVKAAILAQKPYDGA